MSNFMSLAEARIKLNMPKASDQEVRLAAQLRNIQIIDLNLGGIQNTAKWNESSHLGGSTFGAKIAGLPSGDLQAMLSGSSTAKSGGFSTIDDIYGDMGVSFSNRDITSVMPRDNAIIRNGNSSSALPQVDLTSIMQNQNLGEIRLVNGKLVAFDKNGNEMTDAQGRSLNISGTLREGLSSIEFKDGKVIQKDKNGKVIRSDAAAAGQVGYQKDGDSIEERLARFNYKSYKTDPEGAIAKIRNMSPEERRNLEERYFKWCQEVNGAKVAKADFYKLVKNTGMDAAHMKDYAITVLHMSEQEADEVINDFSQRLYTKEDQAAFLNGVVDNVDLADSPEMQVSVVNAAAQAAKAAGISAEVGESIGNAIVANKFHGREATIEALRTQYGLNAEQANKYYANLPEETRQQIEDETLDAITSVQTEVAADSSQPEDVRHNAADLAAEYATYIDDAEYQMQVIQNNMDYIMQNADADMQEYYSTSVANNAYNYDLSNREDVIRMLKEQGFEKTMTALENAKAEYEAKDAENKAATEALKTIQENQQQAQTQDTQDNKKTTSTQQNRQVVSRPTVTPSVNVPQSNVTMPQQTSVPRTGMFGLSSVQTYIMSSEFKSADIKTKEEYISKLNASDKQQAIGTLIENSQDYELQRLMLSSLKKDVLKYLVNHPNPKNNESLTYLKGFLSGADLEYVKELKEERREKMGIRETVSTSPTSTDATAFKRSPFNFEA